MSNLDSMFEDVDFKKDEKQALHFSMSTEGGTVTKKFIKRKILADEKDTLIKLSKRKRQATSIIKNKKAEKNILHDKENLPTKEYEEKSKPKLKRLHLSPIGKTFCYIVTQNRFMQVSILSLPVYVRFYVCVIRFPNFRLNFWYFIRNLKS